MPKKSTTREPINKKKISTQAFIAIVGFSGVIIAACIGVFGTFISSILTYWGNVAQVEIPIIASQTAEAKTSPPPSASPAVLTPTITEDSTVNSSPNWVNNIPLIGEQFDFTVGDGYYGSPEQLPSFFELKSSPYSGIYLDKFYLESFVPSYDVEYKNGERIHAETDLCLINLSYAEEYQSPLNLKSNQIVPEIAVFVDGNYEITITKLDLLLISYTEPRMDFDKVWILMPGAGGLGMPFKNVRTNKVTVNKNQEIYSIDFRDFDLKTYSGVNIFIPILLSDPGLYQFQVKLYAIANPQYQGEYSGEITLTSGRISYEWVKIDDPRNYDLEDEYSYYGGNAPEPNLIPCP